MKTRNALTRSLVKRYTEGGESYEIAVKIRLDDECKNKHCDFGITADIYRLKDGRKLWEAGGCQHEEILKHFPELEPFVRLRVCDHYGVPMYAAANGAYYAKKSKEEAMDYLRITSEEYEQLRLACGDVEAFFCMLHQLGIVDRWKREADAAIASLEEMCGYKWVNPYSEAEERRNIKPLTEEIKKRWESGYYRPESIEKRAKERRRLSLDAKRGEVISRCDSIIRKAEEERDIMLCILEAGLPIDNVIYYESRRQVVFNWKDHEDKISQEEFVDFVSKVDYSELPEGITFSIK